MLGGISNPVHRKAATLHRSFQEWNFGFDAKALSRRLALASLGRREVRKFSNPGGQPRTGRLRLTTAFNLTAVQRIQGLLYCKAKWVKRSKRRPSRLPNLDRRGATFLGVWQLQLLLKAADGSTDTCQSGSVALIETL